MTSYEPRYGASFTAKSGQANPDDVLRQIMEEFPNAPEKETWPYYRAEVLKNYDLIDACIRMCHVSGRRRLAKLSSAKPGKTKKTVAQAAAKTAVKKAAAKTKVKKIKEVMILDHIMPNGEYLRDCTFRYAGKIGGAFSRIAKMGKPNEIIGELLSNEAADAAVK